MALDDKQRERLAELREAEASRQQRAQEDAEARELEALELRAALEKHGLKEGVDFKIVANALGGVYALRKPDARGIRNWENATDKQRANLEWTIGMLRHYVVEPESPETQALGNRGIVWAQMCAQRPGLCWQTAVAFVELMGVDLEGVQKK